MPEAQPQQKNDGSVDVFIGKIPEHLGQEFIEREFRPYGASNLRILSGKGCAFATFQNLLAAERAIKSLNGLKLDRGNGNVSEGINVKFASTKGQNKAKGGPDPKVFIGSLTNNISDDMVREACQEWGTIVEIKVLKDRPGKAPCAFVTYRFFQEAELCIRMLHDTENPVISKPGKTLHVELASELGQKQRGDDYGPPEVNQSFSALANHGQVPDFCADLVPDFCADLVSGHAIQNGVGPQLVLPPPPPESQHAVGEFSHMADQRLRQFSVASVDQMPGAPVVDADGNSPQLFIGGLPAKVSDDFVWGMLSIYGALSEWRVVRDIGETAIGFARFERPGIAELALATISRLGRFIIRYATPEDGAMGGGQYKRNWDAAFPGDMSIKQITDTPTWPYQPGQPVF